VRHRHLTIIAFLSRRLRAMLYQIPSFLLDVIVGLLGGACLLRLYMQYHRVPFGNPLGRFVFAVSDWIVMPLRRIVPSVKRWDLASLIAAWLLVLAKFVLLALLIGSLGRMAILPLVSLVGLAQLAVSGLTALLVVYAVLSWVPGASSVPLRRIIPLVGGVDLSPLAAIVLLQVVAIALGSLMGAVWALRA
jgi:YggT family protein